MWALIGFFVRKRIRPKSADCVNGLLGNSRLTLLLCPAALSIFHHTKHPSSHHIMTAPAMTNGAILPAIPYWYRVSSGIEPVGDHHEHGAGTALCYTAGSPGSQ